MTRNRHPSQHLHHDDYPHTLALLAALTGNRGGELGLHPSCHGSYIDWDTLEQGKLSTTQRAVAHLAHSLADLEGHGGGLPPALAHAVITAATHIVDSRTGGRP